jgi:hypothetical protein
MVRRSSGVSGEDGGAALAEANAGVAGRFAGAAEDDLVTIFEEGAGFTSGEEEGLSSVAGEFEEAAAGGLGGAGDGAGSEDIADLEVAAVTGVVSDELSGGPVEVFCAGFTEEKGSKLIGFHYSG